MVGAWKEYEEYAVEAVDTGGFTTFEFSTELI